MPRGRPKGESTIHVRLPETFVSEVKEFQKKKGIDSFFEAMKLYVSADKDWKKAEIQREAKIEEKYKTEYSERLKRDIEHYVKQISDLENELKPLKEKVENIPKLEMQIKILKAENERLSSDKIMKEYIEMKEKVKRIPILEGRLKEALENRKVEWVVVEDDLIPEYFPFDNKKQFLEWMNEE